MAVVMVVRVTVVAMVVVTQNEIIEAIINTIVIDVVADGGRGGEGDMCV